MGEPKDIYDSFEQMIALCEENVRLMRELKRCLRVADLIGVQPAGLKGVKLGTSVIRDAYYVQPWKRCTFVVTLRREHSEAERKEFPLTQVHLDLWPDDLRERYLRHQRRQDKLQRPL